eukprot:jgi/Psemu1/12803/gm1.12803_g
MENLLLFDHGESTSTRPWRNDSWNRNLLTGTSSPTTGTDNLLTNNRNRQSTHRQPEPTIYSPTIGTDNLLTGNRNQQSTQPPKAKLEGETSISPAELPSPNHRLNGFAQLLNGSTAQQSPAAVYLNMPVASSVGLVS